MGKFDDFDLDVKVNSQSGAEPRLWTSKKLCTPGTCYNGCSGKTTYNSNCCGYTSSTYCITTAC